MRSALQLPATAKVTPLRYVLSRVVPVMIALSYVLAARAFGWPRSPGIAFGLFAGCATLMVWTQGAFNVTALGRRLPLAVFTGVAAGWLFALVA